ncbi:MAG TPA: hypothetical protein VMR75_00050 [Candidatus Saccharimonadales bacterium]|nr:hypothetical protein [Candidatus Saccharimonadales bacterium]
MYEVLYFLAGLFTANGVPHFIKGITGEQHRTPFGKPSSAVTNVLWGSVNFVIAWAIWHYAGMHRSLSHTFRYELAFGLGAFLLALMLASSWSKDSGKSTK